MDEAAALALVERALAPGEALLWSEAAPAGPLRALALGGAALLGALILFFVVVTWKGLRSGGVGQRAMLGLGLALMIVGEIVAVQAIFAAGSTAYAVTDARVLIVSGEPWYEARSYDLADIESLRREDDQLTFRYGPGTHQSAVTLWQLSDPEGVESLIEERLSSH